MKEQQGVRDRSIAARRARVARRGFTLVETLVGVMLIAVVVTSVFSLVLTASVSSTKSERRAQAVFYMKKVMEALKPYVRADPSETTLAPNPTWTLSGDSLGGWALACGTHDVSSWLSAKFCALDATNCHLTYAVTDVACGAACTPCTQPTTNTSCCKQVSVNVVYKDAAQ